MTLYEGPCCSTTHTRSDRLRPVRTRRPASRPNKKAVIQGAARVNLAVVPVREASPPAGSLIGVRVRRVQRVRIQSMDILN